MEPKDGMEPKEPMGPKGPKDAVLLPTTVVGSYSVPEWLRPETRRAAW